MPSSDAPRRPTGRGWWASLRGRLSAADQLRATVAERDQAIAALEAELSRARAEVRYWNDRETFVEMETERARAAAERVESAARERAYAVERDAKDRAAQLIDRVCAEATAILQQARDEAREVTERVQGDVHVTEERVGQLREVQGDIQQAIRTALDSFRDGLRDLDHSVPSAGAIQTLAAAVAPPRPEPDFGRTKAAEAARRFGAVPNVIPGLERDEAPARPVAVQQPTSGGAA